MTNPEIIEKWRAEFESVAFPARINLHHNRRQIFRRSEDGVYLYFSMQDRWEGFLMRCQSLQIPLPKVENLASKQCSIKEIVAFNLGKNICIEDIEAQGYRVGIKE
jgi:hypothetical protein